MTEPNVRQVVPFLIVADIEASLRFYVDGLGARVIHQSIGELTWCWLQLGNAAVQMQQFPYTAKMGLGVRICFICDDAIAFYREVTARGVEAKRPFVLNAMWVTGVTDPDGYNLGFESSTDAPEDSEYVETVENGGLAPVVHFRTKPSS